jgi:hypothetical protein
MNKCLCVPGFDPCKNVQGRRGKPRLDASATPCRTPGYQWDALCGRAQGRERVCVNRLGASQHEANAEPLAG